MDILLKTLPCGWDLFVATGLLHLPHRRFPCDHLPPLATLLAGTQAGSDSQSSGCELSSSGLLLQASPGRAAGRSKR